MEFVSGQRGAPQVLYNGYRFSKARERTRNEIISWRCLRRKNACSGKLHTRNGDVVLHTEHNHPPESSGLNRDTKISPTENCKCQYSYVRPKMVNKSTQTEEHVDRSSSEDPLPCWNQGSPDNSPRNRSPAMPVHPQLNNWSETDFSDSSSSSNESYTPTTQPEKALMFSDNVFEIGLLDVTRRRPVPGYARMYHVIWKHPLCGKNPGVRASWKTPPYIAFPTERHVSRSSILLHT